MTGHDIVTIGASAGGLQALQALFNAAPANLPVGFFIVSHMLGHRPSHLPAILQESGRYPAKFADHGEKALHGHIYVAPPDRHLFFRDGELRLSAGPRENFWRPSVDVLFRSAAVEHGPRAVAVVLSGALDDGTAGLSAIVRCGGVALVQDPREAAYPDMPDSAARNVEEAKVMTVLQIVEQLGRLAREPPVEPRPAVPKELLMEARIAEGDPVAAAESTHVGEPTSHICPECGGPLRREPGAPARFRCHVGHAFGQETLLDGTRKQGESSLWSAIRHFQQRSHLNRSMAVRERQLGRLRGADVYERRAAEGDEHATVLRALLARMVTE